PLFLRSRVSGRRRRWFACLPCERAAVRVRDLRRYASAMAEGSADASGKPAFERDDRVLELVRADRQAAGSKRARLAGIRHDRHLYGIYGWPARVESFTAWNVCAE